MSENDTPSASQATINTHPAVMNPELRFAQAIGTLNSPDRSKQYSRQRGRADNEELLRSLNELWKTARLNEAALRDRDRQIAQLHANLAERDKYVAELRSFLVTKRLKLWVGRILVVAQWGAIGWLATELFSRLK
jgi:hypothetical protein